MTHCCPNASSVAATTAAHRFLFVLRWVGDEESGTWLNWQRPRLTLCATAKLVSAACRSAHALMASSSWGSWGRHRSALVSCRWLRGGLARAAAATAALTVQRSDRWSSCHCSSMAAAWCSDEEVAAADIHVRSGDGRAARAAARSLGRVARGGNSSGRRVQGSCTCNVRAHMYNMRGPGHSAEA